MSSPEDRCDLHLHSHYSDGTLPPEELVRRAGEIGLSAVSVTDHDTLEGQDEALRAGRRFGVDVLEGIEFSIRIDERDMHVLGYLVDVFDAALREAVESLAEARVARASAIVDRLRGEGLNVSMSEIMELSGAGAVGRPHIAKVLQRHGLVTSFQAAFGRYIGEGRSCYVPKTVLPLGEVVSLIKGAGGVAVWAHPCEHIRNERILGMMLDAGVAGLEVWHPNHDRVIESEIASAADEHGLMTTGGSDFHFFEAKQIDIGDVTAPHASVLALRAAVI
jgi:predicted metal-dependent phosphoesterase TrpH